MRVLIFLTLLLQTFRCLFAQSVFTSFPSDNVSVVDSSVTLQCSVDTFTTGDMMQWYKEGVSGGYVTEGTTALSEWTQRAYIEGGSAAYNLGQYNLVISSLHESDAGGYRCFYTAVGSQTIGTHAAILTVLLQPSCSQNPGSVGINEQVELTCTINDLDLNSDIVSYVQWTHVLSSNERTTTTQRTLSGYDNHEEFVCEAVVTGLPEIVRSCSLVPLSISPTASILPSGTLIINVGDTVGFDCFPIAYPYISSIDWLINEESVINYIDVFDFAWSTERSQFNITIKTAEDVRRYYNVICRVYDPKGYIGDSSPTTIVVEPVHTTTVSVPTSHAITTIRVVPTTHTITTIRVVPTTPSVPTSPSVTTTVPLSVGPVLFVQTPSNTYATTGSVIVLECAVNYIGEGEMKWFKVQTGAYIMVGLQVSISASEDIQNRYSIVGGSDAYRRGQYSLQITDVKDSDSGTYFCSYSSADSKSFSSNYAEVTLLAALVCQQSPDYALPPGALVTMLCMVENENERTMVTWYNDQGIQLTIAATNSVTYSLVLQPTDNFRVFTCIAVTDDGDIERTCSLSPLAIQPVVRIMEGSLTALGGMAVNFTCQAEAEPYVSSYQWSIDGVGLDTFNETFEINIIENEILELVPIINGENEAIYNITCTVYIPSGHSTTSEGVILLVTDRGYSSFDNTDTNTLTLVTVVVISLLGLIVFIVILLLCYVLFCHGRRRKLSLERKISFSQHAVVGGRYGPRPSLQMHHIDGFGGAEAIYATPVKIGKGKKQDLAEKKAVKCSRESLYENSAGSDQHPNNVSRQTSEYMNYDHEKGEAVQPVQPVGFPNFGYCPESPTSLRFNTSTLPKKPTVAPRPLAKRLSSFDPLPDVCNSKLNDYFDLPFNAKLENEENHNVDRVQTDELIYSNEPVHHIQTNDNHIYDDFDSDSFDSDSEDETHM